MVVVVVVVAAVSVLVVVVVVVAVVRLSCSSLQGAAMSSAELSVPCNSEIGIRIDNCFSQPRASVSMTGLYTLHILPYCGSAKSVWTLSILWFSAIAITMTITSILLLCNLTKHKQ